jgi:hypothetical protein
VNARVVLLPLAVLLVGGGIALLGGRRAPVKPPADVKAPPAVKQGIPEGEWHPQNVRTEMVPRTEKFPCRVLSPDPFEVTSAVRDTPVEKVLVREGEAVRKGDVLIVFADSQWKRALDAAVKARDDGKAAEARRMLDSLEVRTPADGIVYSLNVRRGERPFLTKGEPLPLAVLYDWTKLSFEGTAPASLAEILAKGPLVFVRPGKGVPVEAEILRNGPVAADGSIPLVLRPKYAPGTVPEPGAEGEIHVVVGAKEVNVVPTTAVRMEGGRPVVYVVTITGDLVLRPVTLGFPVAGRFIEVSGVEKRESVADWE